MQLVWNEQIKLYIRTSTWILFVILAVIVLAAGIITKVMQNDVEMNTYDDDWKVELQQENEQLTKEMEEVADMGMGMESANSYQQSLIDKNNYYIDNDIKPKNFDGWQFVLDMVNFSTIISLFTIIIAAGIVANEFKWGTIKLLLIRPVSRTKILLSKYLSVLLFAAAMLLFTLLFSWIVGSALFGLSGLNPSSVLSRDGQFTEVSLITQIFSNYGFKMVNLVMMATFAFMISSIFRTSGLAIGLSIFLMMAGSSVVVFVSQYDWAKYILFANTDLTVYINGMGPMIEGMTMTFSIIVLLVYYAIFLALSWLVFTKRDVAGQ